jgi:hypothetical protein
MSWVWHVASTCCDKKRHTGLRWENLKERDHLEDLAIEWCVILQTCFKEIVRESVEWIHMTQDRDKWPTVVEDGNESADSIKCREHF